GLGRRRLGGSTNSAWAASAKSGRKACAALVSACRVVDIDGSPPMPPRRIEQKRAARRNEGYPARLQDHRTNTTGRRKMHISETLAAGCSGRAQASYSFP